MNTAHRITPAAAVEVPPPPVKAAVPAHSEGARVGRNTAFRAAAQAVSALINVGAMVLLGNRLSAAGYGEYAYWYALIPLISSTCDLGAGTIVTREMVRRPADAARTLGDGLLLRALVATLLLALSVASRLMLPAGLLSLVVLAAVFDFSTDSAVWTFRARERLDLESVLLLVSQLAWLAGIVVALSLGGSLPYLLGSAVVAYVLRTIVGATMLVRMGLRPRFELDAGRVRRLVAEGWPIGLALVLVVVYGRVGVFVLKALSTRVDVACFNVSYLLSQPFGFLASALSMAAFPAFARRASRPQAGSGIDPQGLAGPMRAAIKYQLVVSVPIGAGLLLLAGSLVPLLFHGGKGYEGAVATLRVMSLAVPFVFVNLHSRYLLAAIGRQRIYLAAVCVGLVVNVVGCVLTARTFGAIGAAWTFAIAEVLVFMVCQTALAAEVPLTALLAQAWRPVAGALVMAVAVVGVHGAGWLVQVAVGAVAYGAVLVATRALSPAEWSVLRGVLATFRPSRPARLAGRTGPA
ncbi:MAG TPA: oligosaccharide flippase family protein [Verrucomicrobiae bacterium]|nr:oligosaccharide flippase family protein [Verrucomicrobiae bacterium]